MMDLVSLNVRFTLILRTDRVLKSYLTFKLTHGFSKISYRDQVQKGFQRRIIC